MKRTLWCGLLCWALGWPAAFGGEPALSVTIAVDQAGAKISSTMWGIFFEDINFGADGGLYAELIKNRSFEFPDPLLGWTAASNGADQSLSIAEQHSLSATNRHYLHLRSSTGTPTGVVNRGFRGIGLRAGEKYQFSTFVRGTGRMSLRVLLVGANDAILAEEQIKGIGADWKRRTISLRSKATEPQGALKILAEGEGNLDLDVVSLFPERTWKGRPNGLRADLVQMLADLKPGFMRFPGGCIVEGRVLETRYQWKTTVGKPEDRQLIVNRWNDEFKHRPAPDYFQSFGLGFFEFFQMCEDIGAQPLPILNCGMACQFNSGQLAPLDALQPYIQDALDLIEFANGAPDTPWGRVRAQMGHRRPFGMKLLGVGNEQWGPQYIERYTRFAQALKAAHPEIQLISSAGPGPADDKFEFAWPKLRELQADIVDEHCYARPDWFLDNSTRYDRYDRHGPKVFMGEYAAQSVKTVSPDNHNNWECALGEAAYMIGLERNADVVVMSSYAPLFGHVDAWQWTPNLIWFDNLRAYGTPNYYVQQLFARNRGDILLPVRMSGAPHAANDQPRLYASATRDIASSEVILKVVNATPNALVARLDLAGARKVKPRGQAFVLTGSRIDLENSLDEPRRVAPRLEAFAASAVPFDYTFEPTSMTVLRMKVALP